MTIRARLFLSALIPFILGVFGVGVLYGTSQELDRTNEQVVMADQLARGVFELNTLSYDYLLYANERAKVQWEATYNTISDRLEDLIVLQPSGTNMLGRIQKNLKSIQEIFGRIIDAKSGSMSAEVTMRLENRSVGLLMTQSRLLVTDIYRLADLSKARATQKDLISKWIVVGILGGVILISSLTSFLVGQSVLVPIARLQEGTEVIANGNLSYRVAYKGTNEVSALGAAFNHMTERLEISYQNLQEEIDVRKEAEHQLRELNQTLEDRVERRTLKLEERNRELDEFAYVASHDLRSPLRAVDNLVQWVREDLGDEIPDGSKRHLMLMQERVNRLEKLLDDLLHYSRAGRYAYQSEKVDTQALVGEILELLQDDSTLQFKIADNLPVFETVKPPFQQVFQNLINNAIKYHDKKDGVIEVGWEDQDVFYCFWVRDDGPGIAPEYHEKVFQMFQQLQSRDVIEGTGIGLAVVKKTIEGYGGKIELISDVGQGARFEFTWPKSIDQGGTNV